MTPVGQKETKFVVPHVNISGWSTKVLDSVWATHTQQKKDNKRAAGQDKQTNISKRKDLADSDETETASKMKGTSDTTAVGSPLPWPACSRGMLEKSPREESSPEAHPCVVTTTNVI